MQNILYIKRKKKSVYSENLKSGSDNEKRDNNLNMLIVMVWFTLLEVCVLIYIHSEVFAYKSQNVVIHLELSAHTVTLMLSI